MEHQSWNLSKLQDAQNSMALVVLQERKQSYAEPFLRSLHWLPVDQRDHYKSADLPYKVHAHQRCDYLNDLISFCVTNTLNSTDGINSFSGRASFNVRAPVVWNILPLCICVTVFKLLNQTEDILFNSAFTRRPGQSTSESSECMALYKFI